MDYSKFRENLQKLMSGRSETISDFSDKINIPSATISRYLSGARKEPRIDYIVKIAEHYNVTVDWLLGLNDDKFELLTKQQQELLLLYSTSSDDDKAVIQAVLNKYRKEH